MRTFFEFLNNIGKNILFIWDNDDKNMSREEKFCAWMLSLLVLLVLAGIVWFLGWLIWGLFLLLLTKAGLKGLMVMGLYGALIFVLAGISLLIGKLGMKGCDLVDGLKKISAKLDEKDEKNEKDDTA